jgi:hypothetical protein
MMYAQLAATRQFDPNATITQGMRTTNEGIDQTYYTLNFDPSKLPAHAYPNANLTGVGGYGNDKVYNSDNRYFVNDPNYGVMTDPRNIDKREGFDWLSLAPLAVAAFAGFGAPMLAAAMSGGALGAGAAGAGAAGAGLTAADLGSAESSLYGSTVAAAPEYALGSPMVAGSAESSLYGPEVYADASHAVGSYAPGYGQNALGQLYGRTAITAGQQLGNRRFDPFAFVPAAAAGAGAPWWTAPAVQGGKLAYDVSQYDRQQPQQQQPQPQAYDPKNYGKLNQPTVPSGDTQPVATSYADAPYGRWGSWT